jgi:hypothetical protein
MNTEDSPGEIVGALAEELLHAREALKENGFGWCEPCHIWKKYIDETGSCPECYTHLLAHET